jgi:hypothetical protein
VTGGLPPSRRLVGAALGRRALIGILIAVIAQTVGTVLAHAQSSSDPTQQFVARLYRDVLGRDPDPSGLAGWVGFLNANCHVNGLATIARGFFDSPEFRDARGLSLAGRVSAIYRTFLGREADPGGLAGWANVLRQAGLMVATRGFIPSVEFRSVLPDPTNRPAVAALVTRLYEQILQRQPDPPGLNGWVDFITSTGDFATAAVGFLASAEFESRALTTRDYVSILYRTFLNREPDPAGLRGWQNVLQDALLDVINAGFIPSIEYQGQAAAICPGPLTNATNFTGAYPTPSTVSYTTRDGRTVQVSAFPGQVQAFFSSSTADAAATQAIAARGGSVLSKAPRLNYYLVGVASGSDAAFINAIRSAPGIVNALPNLAVDLREVVINPAYFTTEMPVPLNVPPGVIVIDDGAHGADVATTVANAGGTVGARVNLAIQCVGCSGKTSAHHVGLIVAAAAHGNAIFNPGNPLVGNISYGPELPGRLLAENAPAALVAQNQAANETFLASLLSVMSRLPANEQANLAITFAFGNSHVDLTGAVANVRNDSDAADLLFKNLLLVATNQPFSNFVAGRDHDLMSSNNPEAAFGTSFAAPAVAAILQQTIVQRGLTLAQAVQAAKLADAANGQVTLAGTLAQADRIRSTIAQVMAATGVTAEQASLAIELAIRGNANNALVLSEAIARANAIRSAAAVDPAGSAAVQRIAFTSVGTSTGAAVTPAIAGVTVQYTVSGTDGYFDSGSLRTNSAGRVSFAIPAGQSGVVDTITVTAVLSGRIARTTFRWP